MHCISLITINRFYVYLYIFLIIVLRILNFNIINLNFFQFCIYTFVKIINGLHFKNFINQSERHL